MGHRHDLGPEDFFLQGPGRFLLAFQGEGVLVLPGDVPPFGHVFRGFAHGVAADGIEQDQLVHEPGMTQPGAPAAGGQQIGRVGHVLQSAGGHDIGVAGLDCLGGQKHGFQGSAAGLGHGVLGDFDGHAGVYGNGPGHVGRQDAGTILLGKDDFLDLFGR